MNTIKVHSMVLITTCAVLLAGCATTPTGPTVAVMPAPNKPFEVFQQDQAICKQYASQQISGQADAANQRGVGEAIVGTAIGATAGALLGGGRGAAQGAAVGGVVGTGVGASSSGNSQYSLQQQYNIAYTQCMYSKGNQIAGYRRYTPPPQPYYAAPPPPSSYPPPPPPPGSYPPPPPPGY